VYYLTCYAGIDSAHILGAFELLELIDELPRPQLGSTMQMQRRGGKFSQCDRAPDRSYGRLGGHLQANLATRNFVQM